MPFLSDPLGKCVSTPVGQSASFNCHPPPYHTFLNWHRVSIQSSKRAWSGRKHEKALSRLRNRLSRDRQIARTLRHFTRGYHRFYYGSRREASLNLPCCLIPAPHPSATWPSCSYSSELRATRGTLWSSTTLPFCRGSWWGGPDHLEMRHHTLCFRAFSNHLLRGGASEGEKVWKPAGGFRACLDRVQRSFGLGVDENFITPIKNFPSR